MCFLNESVLTEIFLKRIKGKRRGKDSFRLVTYSLLRVYVKQRAGFMRMLASSSSFLLEFCGRSSATYVPGMCTTAPLMCAVLHMCLEAAPLMCLECVLQRFLSSMLFRNESVFTEISLNHIKGKLIVFARVDGA